MLEGGGLHFLSHRSFDKWNLWSVCTPGDLMGTTFLTWQSVPMGMIHRRIAAHRKQGGVKESHHPAAFRQTLNKSPTADPQLRLCPDPCNVSRPRARPACCVHLAQREGGRPSAAGLLCASRSERARPACCVHLAQRERAAEGQCSDLPAKILTSHQPPATSHQPPATSHQNWVPRGTLTGLGWLVAGQILAGQMGDCAMGATALYYSVLTRKRWSVGVRVYISIPLKRSLPVGLSTKYL
eukprot:1195936-Prorocentrum_minimum.AAC.3